jgi:hypothetical protein
MFVGKYGDDGARAAADFIHDVMERFGFPGKWAFHALHSDGRCYGMSRAELERLYTSAEVLINLHGGTAPLEEHAATGRLLFLGTDPGRLEVELFHGNQATIEILDAHTWHFTFAENYRHPDCSLPVTELFDLQPTRQPVVLEWWERYETPGSGLFTTVGNWRQGWRDVRFLDDTYRWSKHHEFLRFLDLPARTGQRFELALSSIDDDGRKVLHGHGWRVRDAHELDWDLDGYRDYIGTSRGEYTVAKDQNVRLRSGWFSDRGATYLAAGRPVITQDTGFGNVLPVGRGLFPFSTTPPTGAPPSTSPGPSSPRTSWWEASSCGPGFRSRAACPKRIRSLVTRVRHLLSRRASPPASCTTICRSSPCAAAPRSSIPTRSEPPRSRHHPPPPPRRSRMPSAHPWPAS